MRIFIIIFLGLAVGWCLYHTGFQNGRRFSKDNWPQVNLNGNVHLAPGDYEFGYTVILGSGVKVVGGVEP